MRLWPRRRRPRTHPGIELRVTDAQPDHARTLVGGVLNSDDLHVLAEYGDAGWWTLLVESAQPGGGRTRVEYRAVELDDDGQVLVDVPGSVTPPM